METDRSEGNHRLDALGSHATDLCQEDLLAILSEVRRREYCTQRDVDGILRRHRRGSLPPHSRAELVAAYRQLCSQGTLPFEREMLRRLQRKPIRTLSGVAPVTALTKPFRCCQRSYPS